MNTAYQVEENTMHSHPNQSHRPDHVMAAITACWSKIAPCFPLRSMVAVNPLQGFEHLPFEEAIKQGHLYFQGKDLPKPMHDINRETIKWLQVYTDEGQATISMPLRYEGLLKSMRKLMAFDENIGGNDPHKIIWLKNLPESPHDIIRECLFYLNIKVSKVNDFLSLMLTTLPGWAAHIQYRCSYGDAAITREDYLAIRLMITCLMWPEAKQLLSWHESLLIEATVDQRLNIMCGLEAHYKDQLLGMITKPTSVEQTMKPVQFVFCIDVRSEPFRRALEAQGKYETLGFAGFFGVPVMLKNQITHEESPSCPVLLKPTFSATLKPCREFESAAKGYNRLIMIKKLYQSLKYNFTTPFALAEILGPMAGMMIMLRTSFPKITRRMKMGWLKKNHQHGSCSAHLSDLSSEAQCDMAENALRIMGLTSQFSDLVVFCGHGSQTENNAYASALDCGACGGRSGGYNAQILADLLNTPTIRLELYHRGIHIPETTYFIAAEHNTTTDEVVLFDTNAPQHVKEHIASTQADLHKAQALNCQTRAGSMDIHRGKKSSEDMLFTRACDWSEVRPEWGLADNASFIVGPRTLTAHIDLEGRSFLHSYDWSNDQEGKHLEVILTAPMIVAQWINSQYLFSTWDNVSYGSGSKITQNITGKMGIMQGNASDLMHGLPLQSVYKDDKNAYHHSQRLMAVIYAPVALVTRVIERNEILIKLLSNDWVHLTCLDPQTNTRHDLNRDLTWT